MKKIFSFVVLYFLLMGYTYSFANNVYIGIAIEGEKILLQDHIYANNESFWKENEYGSIYEDYMDYIEKFLLKNGYSLQDTSDIYFEKYFPEFKKLTDIKVGEEYYLSTSKGVFKAIVTGYCFVPTDTYINGNIFYVVLENKDNTQLDLDEPVIISKNENMTPLTLSQNLEKSLFNKYKNIIVSSLSGKKVKVYDAEEDKDKLVSIESFEDESFVILKGHFTNKDEDQYIINFSQRITFEFYVNTSYIVDSDGNILYEMITLQDKDYSYFIVKGIADINGDGLDEILADQGYYEGAGYYLYKFDGNEFIVIADGFINGL